MLLQGLVLMVVGIFMVFSFLLLLVFILTACEKIIPRFNYLLPDEQPKAKTSRGLPLASGSSTRAFDEKVAVAIAVAIAQSQNTNTQR